MNLAGIRGIVLAALIAASVTQAGSMTQTGRDPHRPACKSARCLKIEAFLRSHYCGVSPFANGPDGGCELKNTGKRQAEVTADYECKWNDTQRSVRCEQRGQPPPTIREILLSQLHRLGLPANANGETNFTLRKSAHSGWSLATAHYSRIAGAEVELCEVVVVVDQALRVTVLRKLTFQKTDADVPEVTQWSPVDVADVEGNGIEDVILEGDAYENHWLEVVTVHDGNVQTIYSGLGYYL
jgi:hypothetical protein